jgi:hypothetical protein
MLDAYEPRRGKEWLSALRILLSLVLPILALVGAAIISLADGSLISYAISGLLLGLVIPSPMPRD